MVSTPLGRVQQTVRELTQVNASRPSQLPIAFAPAPKIRAIHSHDTLMTGIEKMATDTLALPFHAIVDLL